MKYPKDYHSYVFQNGKFVGKFDDMYRYSSEIPWRQDKNSEHVFSNIDISILKQFKYNSICEIGCGYGYFSNRLRTELRSKKGKYPEVTGIDISQAAVKKALRKFPKIRFIVGDLIKDNPLPKEQFDLVVIKELLWYVCHKLPEFLQNVTEMIKKSGFIYVSQSFPETDKWVGQEIISSYNHLKEILLKYAVPIHYCVEWDYNYHGRPLVHYLGRCISTNSHR